MKTHKVFGPPGTGKTTYLLNRVEETLTLNIAPSQIGFFSFTTKAAEEAKFRAIRKFPKYVEQEFRYFRTLHSLALESIGGAANYTIMDKGDWSFLGERLGLTFTGKGQALWDDTLTWDGVTVGDKVRALCDLARLRNCTLKEAWRRSDVEGVNLPEIERFQKSLHIYKSNRGMIDFCDMLEMACTSNTLPSYKLLIIDEAQDLSSLQWNLVSKLVDLSDKCYIAGDDDQAIFQWAGADVERFINFPGYPVILDQSYRVPVSVSKVAERLQKGIIGRVTKEWKPREDQGKVVKHYTLDPITIGLDQGEWLILVRNNYQIKTIVDMCVENGFWFTCKMSSIRSECVPAVVAWEKLRQGEEITISDSLLCYSFMSSRSKRIEHGYKAVLQKAEELDLVSMKELHEKFGLRTSAVWFDSFDALTPVEISYLWSCRRKGEKLLKAPRIKISTIHGAKGGEADNVILLTDYSRATDNNFVRFPADEHRVWYVGVTRARNTLHIISPQTDTYFRPICY